MNTRIQELAKEAGITTNLDTDFYNKDSNKWVDYFSEKFAELIKQAIYDEVKEELMADEMINIEPDSLSREYLKGCNGGIIDALCLIKNFGVDVDE